MDLLILELKLLGYILSRWQDQVGLIGGSINRIWVLMLRLDLKAKHTIGNRTLTVLVIELVVMRG
jgi:hypothetical protein